MKHYLITLLLFCLTSTFIFCKENSDKTDKLSISKIGEIPLPNGFERVVLDKGSFGEWLRYFPLSKDNTVYLYNGSVKNNQQIHYAVLDISVGKKIYSNVPMPLCG